MKNDRETTNNSTLKMIRDTNNKIETYNRNLKREKHKSQKLQLAFASTNALSDTLNKYNHQFYNSVEHSKILYVLSPYRVHHLFCVYNNRLTPLGRNINLDTPKAFFNYIIKHCQIEGLIPDYSLPIYQKLFQSVFDYLKYRPLSPYYAFLQKYSLHFNIHSVFYDTNNFVYINKNLFAVSQKGFISQSTTLNPLDKNLILKLYGEHPSHSRKFFNVLPSHITKLVSKEKMVSDKEITYFPNSLFLYKHNRAYAMRFLSNKIEILNNAAPFLYHTNSVFTIEQLENAVTQKLSDSCIRLLHALSSGSIDKLIEISILWANISTNAYRTLEKSKRFMYVLNGNSNSVNTWKVFLEKCNLRSPFYNGLNYLTKRETLTKLTTYPLQNITYIASTPSKRTESPQQRADLLKLIQGNTIAFKNDIGLPMHIKNKLPILCYADTQADINRLLEEYPSKSITLNIDTDIYNNISKELTPQDYDKIATFLSLLGLCHLTNTKSIEKNNNATDGIIDILSSFCYHREGEYLYFEDIYNYYLEYCKHTSINAPLSSILLNKALKQRYAHKRPRKSKTDNRWAYTDLAFHIDDFRDFFHTSNENVHTYDTEFTDTILQYQDTLASLFKNALDNFHPDTNTPLTHFYEIE